MQESRLFKIIYHLLNKGSSTAPELAEKFEVSVRTIYRDMDAISSAGIPIYATQGKGGGIALLENFVLDKSLLSATEKEQLLMALQGLIATKGENSGELLTKLGSLFQIPNRNWIEVDFIFCRIMICFTAICFHFRIMLKLLSLIVSEHV